MVQKLMHLHKLLRTELAASNCTWHQLLGAGLTIQVENLLVPGVGAATTAQDKAGKLKELFSFDFVHLTGLGYT